MLADVLGWRTALAAQLGFMGLLAVMLQRLARPAIQTPADPAPASPHVRFQAVLSGPWPMVAAAAMLALGNLWTLLVAGHPWSITWGFTLWGAKAAQWLGWQPSSSPFWQGGFQSEAISGGLLDDTTSMMDLAIMLGRFVQRAWRDVSRQSGTMRCARLQRRCSGG